MPEIRGTTQVSYRLPTALVRRLKDVTNGNKGQWPPPPSQTDVVVAGLQHMLDKLERNGERKRARRAG